MKTSEYAVSMPDGTITTRKSDLIYTHAVIATDGKAWRVVEFCSTIGIAFECAANWYWIAPDKPCRVVTICSRATNN